MTLVECVPNFSEGRDAAKVEAIIAAMKVDGVYLLDKEMDADHNRCVITLAGDRDAVAEAAIRGVGKAAELIDLTGTDQAQTWDWRYDLCSVQMPGYCEAAEKKEQREKDQQLHPRPDDCAAVAEHLQRIFQGGLGQSLQS